jgi:phosphotransferase system enzyme I (PtsI)
LRASVLGDVRFMFPLISTLVELRQAKMVLADVMEDLEEHGIPFRRDIPIGIMVEVPSVVILIDRFVEEIDFISVGTNDLIQYTLAVDRDNKEVAGLYNASDPAVLTLIESTIRAAKRRNIPVNVCGQMSSSTTYTMLLLGMGLRQLSVTPAAIPELKKLIRSVTIEQCEAVYQQVKRLENARDVKNYLKEELKKVLPELPD